MFLLKLKEKLGTGKILIFSKQKHANRLDYGSGLPAAANSGQKQPGLEFSCLDRTDVFGLDRADVCC